MSKQLVPREHDMTTILITGSTDGIGLETAKLLAKGGHSVLLHGRNKAKLDQVAQTLAPISGGAKVETFVADLSDMAAVEGLAAAVADRTGRLDVLINNAGIFKTPDTRTADGLDVRFTVNTIAPYLLTMRLLPQLEPSGRVVNLSSAAQNPVDLKALAGWTPLSDMAAYSQSKLALTAWSMHLARTLGETGPAIIAVNPGSLLATKMVKEGFGVAGSDIRIGADVLYRAALSEEFASASGRYFDNDSGRFDLPHPDALDPAKSAGIVRAIEACLARLSIAA
jgi:NAD(P)-dependent dehydrogenase (short-subunit alcohol dehydrogenase family)